MNELDLSVIDSFNTQPPEGGWTLTSERWRRVVLVSTHSRLKAAGERHETRQLHYKVSTHSRLKAAGELYTYQAFFERVSTHSRLKAAG